MTARRAADIILPSTSWLEELGCKATNTHLYLVDKVLDAPGETKSFVDVLKSLAARLGLEKFYPWLTHEACINTVIDHPFTGHATVAKLRDSDGRVALQTSHVAYPTHTYHTPSVRLSFIRIGRSKLGCHPARTCR